MYFFWMCLFLLLNTRMFPACCFRQRTYMVQGFVNGVLSETWIHLCLQFECFSVGYGFFLSVFTLAYFTPHLLLRFDTLFSLCVCVLVWFRILLNVCLEMLCVCAWSCGLKYTGKYILLTIFVCLYIYIYIYSHPQSHCFVLSELFSVARHAGRSKPGSKPVQLYVRLSFRPLGH